LQEIATTVGTNIVESGVGTIATKGAFERTDERIVRIGGEVFVARFTIRAYL
jgi:hypothetical protein